MSLTNEELKFRKVKQALLDIKDPEQARSVALEFLEVPTEDFRRNSLRDMPENHLGFVRNLEKEKAELQMLGLSVSFFMHDFIGDISNIKYNLIAAFEAAPEGSRLQHTIQRAQDAFNKIAGDWSYLGSLQVGQHGGLTQVTGKDIEAFLSKGRNRYEKNFQIVFTPEFAEYSVWAIQTSFMRVVDNLVRNAYRAMRDANTENPTVEFDFQDGNLLVRDSGPGIPPGDVPFIFDPFFTTKIRGGGIGLHIIQKNLERFSLQAKYEKDKKLGGACFIIGKKQNEVQV